MTTSRSEHVMPRNLDLKDAQQKQIVLQIMFILLTLFLPYVQDRIRKVRTVTHSHIYI
jgi:hypothetical protein